MYVKEVMIDPGAWAKIEKNTVPVVAGRGNANATNIWLRRAQNIPMNLSPFIAEHNMDLIAISVSTRNNETWIAEVYKNSDIVSPPTPSNRIAFLSMSSVSSKREVLGAPVEINDQDKIGIFCQGAGISYPVVRLLFKERY